MVAMDLFGFLVQGLFGSIIMATVFMIVVFWVFGGFMKMGTLLISTICILYVMIILTAGYGGVVGMVTFLAASIYFATAVIPWIGSMWERWL